MPNLSLSSIPIGQGAAFTSVARADFQTRSYALDGSAEERAGVQKKEAAERQFRAAFLRQLLEPLTRQLISTSESSGGVGTGMETYRFFLEEALAGHLERQWPLPTLDLDPAGAEARRAVDVQRAAALYAGPTLAGAVSALTPPRLETSSAGGSAPESPPVSPPMAVADLTSHRSVQESTLSRSIHQAAASVSLPDSLLRAVVEVESGGRSDAVSPAGAQGLMQLMPATAAELGVTNPFDPKQNLEGGARYLAEQLDRFDGDIRLALAAYNAGPGAVKRHGGVPPYPETVRYIDSVLDWKARFDSESGSGPDSTPVGRP